MRLPQETLSPAVFADRRARLADVFEAKKLDGFFLGGVSDLYYLTGFHSEGFYGLVTAKGCWLFVSALLAEQVRQNTPGCTIVSGKRLSVAVGELASKYKLKRLGFDAEQINFRLGDMLRKNGFKPVANPIEELRILKDSQELERLAEACEITADAVERVSAKVRVGMTEKQMALAIESHFYRRGAGGVGFDLIAAVGDHTALPHHVPGSTPLKRDSAVLFDVGCRVGAYRSDLTRSFYYGKIPATYRRIYGIVEAAHRAGVDTVRPGATGGQVDAAARTTITKAGYGRTFIHSTGHGVGIDIHEPPWIRPQSPDVLKPNMVLTVEPGIYLPGKYGVRIEDTLRVTPSGHVILTKTH